MFTSTTEFVFKIHKKLHYINRTQIMGILNVTPDSFFDGNKYKTDDLVKQRIETMVHEGADIIDVGGQSSRPGSVRINAEDEWNRIRFAVNYICKNYPNILVSIDTYHGEVFRKAHDLGASIFNDISAWHYDPSIPELVAELEAPYVLMHMQGTPETMQDAPSYKNVVSEVLSFIDKKRSSLVEAGVKDIIIDPGIGFGKTVEHNLCLIKHLDLFTRLGCLVLLGVSQKNMFRKIANAQPEEILGMSSAVHLFAMQNGARILRVHDVAEAARIRALFEAMDGIER